MIERSAEETEHLSARKKRINEVSAGYGVSWFFVNVAASEAFRTPYPAVRRDWSLRSLIEASAALDAIEELREIAANEAKQRDGA